MYGRVCFLKFRDSSTTSSRGVDLYWGSCLQAFLIKVYVIFPPHSRRMPGLYIEICLISPHFLKPSFRIIQSYKYIVFIVEIMPLNMLKNSHDCHTLL
jgi:hypothetical protein